MRKRRVAEGEDRYEVHEFPKTGIMGYEQKLGPGNTVEGKRE